MLEIGQEMPVNVATFTGARPASPEAPTASADLAAIKARQHAAWSSGDYAVVGTTLQIVGEELCEALDLRSGRKVLDVAAGNGMVSLAAARRWCDVTSTDYVRSEEHTSELQSRLHLVCRLLLEKK